MGLERSSPVAIEVLGELNEPQIEANVKELVQRIKDSDEAQAAWLRKQLNLIRLNHGPRRPRNFPWKGASNINVPLTDGIIRRFRPGMAALVLDQNPVATFYSPDPTDDTDVGNDELFFHWLWTERMKPAEEVVRLIDLYASRGHAYAREGWRYETERFSRVARVNELFPQGLEPTLQAAQEQARLQNPDAEPPSAVDLVVQVLESEFNMDANDEDEGLQLVEAARRILEGEAYVRITYNAVMHDRPDWRALDPINVIADQDAPDVEDADFFAIVHRLTPDQILRMARDGKFNKAVAVEVAAEIQDENDTAGRKDTSAHGVRAQIRALLDKKSGVNKQVRRKAGMPRGVVWEIYGKIDINADSINERVVIWYAPDQDRILAVTEYPFPFASWPVTLVKFEPYAPRPVESRGIPELLFEMQKLVNAQHNLRLDAGQLLLSPAFKRRITGATAEEMSPFKPGAVLPVANTADLEMLVNDLRPLTELLREEQVTQRMAESFIGTFDATISNLQNNSERRTAAEVNAVTQLASNVFGLDARMFQTAMARSFAKIWSLYLDLGPDQTYFRVMGEPKPRKALKHELGKKYDLKPAGSPSSTNRSFMLGAMERAMPLVLQDQSGVFDRTALIAAWLEMLDPKLAKKIVRSPDQAQAAQLVQQAAQIAADGRGIDPSQIAPP